MPDKYIINELLFRRCEHWDTDKCPFRNKAVMGLTVINRSNLFLLSDATVAELNQTCGGCEVFTRKNPGEQSMADL